MYSDLVIFRCFLFETGRSPIPSSGQHDERAITQAAGVPHGIVDIGIRAGSRNDSALVSGGARLLRIGPIGLRLRFEPRQCVALLRCEIGRRRAPLPAPNVTNYSK